MHRRTFLHQLTTTAACGFAAVSATRLPAAPTTSNTHSPDLVSSIERETIFHGREKGTSWFSTRACMVPGKNGPIALMMMAEITGSDHFGPVHLTESSDLGKSWTKPVPVPGLGRTPANESLGAGVSEGSCDWVPEYHAPTQSVLAMGHNVFYKGKGFFAPQPPRHTTYIVRDSQGNWGTPKKLLWDDSRGAYIYTCNCAQRVTMENGDVLVPLSFGPKSDARSVSTVRCSFDGRDLEVLQVGTELKNAKGRGFLEPSLARLGARIFMTIRAEDNRGYVTTSDDGLAWSPPTAWIWDDGEPISMSTTQQRWLVHSDSLYLVYTRKAEENVNVMRWRAPLYLAKVDSQSLRLVRATERIAIPLHGDGIKAPKDVPHLGNFHTMIATPEESWITVGEMKVSNYRGDVQLARVRWKSLNKT